MDGGPPGLDPHGVDRLSLVGSLSLISVSGAVLAVEDSSDEDEPLIRMIKKAPSDDQLKETVQGLLKEADLEEMTMKKICQKVPPRFCLT